MHPLMLLLLTTTITITTFTICWTSFTEATQSEIGGARWRFSSSLPPDSLLLVNQPIVFQYLGENDWNNFTISHQTQWSFVSSSSADCRFLSQNATIAMATCTQPGVKQVQITRPDLANATDILTIQIDSSFGCYNWYTVILNLNSTNTIANQPLVAFTNYIMLIWALTTSSPSTEEMIGAAATPSNASARLTQGLARNGESPQLFYNTQYLSVNNIMFNGSFWQVSFSTLTARRTNFLISGKIPLNRPTATAQTLALSRAIYTTHIQTYFSKSRTRRLVSWVWCKKYHIDNIHSSRYQLFIPCANVTPIICQSSHLSPTSPAQTLQLFCSCHDGFLDGKFPGLLHSNSI